MRYFCSGFLHWSNIYRPNNKAFECFQFCTWIRRLIKKNFYIQQRLSWRQDSFQSTESMPSETSCWLSRRGVRLHGNWVNTEWWNLRQYWCLLRWLSWCGVSLWVDSVDMLSRSALTQLMGSPTPRRLSVRKMNQTRIGMHTKLWRL